MSAEAADPSAGRFARLRETLAKTGRIARWEASKTADTVDRRTLLAIIVLLAAVGVVGVVAIDDGVGLDDGLYTVGTDGDSPYATVVEDDDRLRYVSTSHEAFVRDEVHADAFVGDGGLLEYRDDAIGEAAAETVRDAIERHNDRVLADEPDQAAAYPVWVSILYEVRGGPESGPAAGSGGSEGESSDGATDTGDGTGVGGGEDGSGDGDDGTGVSDDGTGDGDTVGSGGDLGVPELGNGGASSGEIGAPGAISPPFPFEALVLAFLFVVPMNFVIQAYGSTILDERIGRRGELLLVAPVSTRTVVAGKTLPYLLALIGIVVAITVFVGGGPISVLAAVPIALVFLAATFVAAMFARSFKELTFLTVTISVVLTTYTFVPAIFTDVNAIALISPLSLVVMDLQGDPVSLGEYLFSTSTFYAGSAVLFVLGLGLYREEDMFTQKPVTGTAADAIVMRIRSLWSVPALTILFVPFVFAAQLLAISLVFALPEAVALPIILIIAAAIEELAKSIHVYAGFERGRFTPSLRTALLLGGLSGTGFFVGEKVTHAVQFVGLSDLTVGQAAFGPVLGGHPLVILALFLAPLVLHVITAGIAAVGASRGRNWYAVGFVVATFVHAGYNLGVIALVA